MGVHEIEKLYRFLIKSRVMQKMNIWRIKGDRKTKPDRIWLTYSYRKASTGFAKAALMDW